MACRAGGGHGARCPELDRKGDPAEPLNIADTGWWNPPPENRNRTLEFRNNLISQSRHYVTLTLTIFRVITSYSLVSGHQRFQAVGHLYVQRPLRQYVLPKPNYTVSQPQYGSWPRWKLQISVKFMIALVTLRSRATGELNTLARYRLSIKLAPEDSCRKDNTASGPSLNLRQNTWLEKLS